MARRQRRYGGGVLGRGLGGHLARLLLQPRPRRLRVLPPHGPRRRLPAAGDRGGAGADGPGDGVWAGGERGGRLRRPDGVLLRDEARPPPTGVRRGGVAVRPDGAVLLRAAGLERHRRAGQSEHRLPPGVPHAAGPGAAEGGVGRRRGDGGLPADPALRAGVPLLPPPPPPPEREEPTERAADGGSSLGGSWTTTTLGHAAGKARAGGEENPTFDPEEAQQAP